MSKRNLTSRSHMGRGCSSAGELAREHLHLVAEVARSFHNRLPANVDLDDIVGDGSVGLAEAAQRFSPWRGTSFRTFAKYRILGAIVDGLRKSDSVSRDLRCHKKAAERTIINA